MDFLYKYILHIIVGRSVRIALRLLAAAAAAAEQYNLHKSQPFAQITPGLSCRRERERGNASTPSFCPHVHTTHISSRCVLARSSRHDSAAQIAIYIRISCERAMCEQIIPGLGAIVVYDDDNFCVCVCEHNKILH